MKYFNENEKYITTIVVWLASIEGLLITISSILSTEEYKVYVVSSVFVVLTAILLFFKQKIITTLISFIKPNSKKRKINSGKWLLQISFNDNTADIQGTCNIEHSLSGVKIYGGKLLDENSNITRKDNWLSENVEILNQNDNDILIYLYKNPTDDIVNNQNYDDMVFDKLGLVVAYRDKGADGILYKGIFRDFPLQDDQQPREGKVVLSPIDE